ncbi:MAG: UbiA prenyltransferase family protein [Methanomassiliicoccales archaeon]|nr:MAG: UbiA prenyltransferase family protein [Methanomassiliicoccales archaeon]
MTEKIKAYADLARVHGVSVTASMSLLGALTSTAGLNFITAAYLVIIGFFTHISLNALNELKDVEIDSQIPESSLKPLVRGVISIENAKKFVMTSIIVLFLLLFMLFPRPEAIIVFLMSYIWLFWYCWGIGKRISYSFDISFAAGYTLFALFGTYAVGNPTIYTWILMGAMVAISLF